MFHSSRLHLDQFLDRSNRRCSDSQAVMVSPDVDDSSPRSLHYEDPIRTEEYKRAFAEFLARRSLGPIKEDHTKEESKRPRKNQQVEKKQSKRLSLPDTRSHQTEFSSPTTPQIQFSFSNQFYMSTGDKKAKKHLHNGSLTSTSPDLLPPRFIRDRHVDFDNGDNPSSPPNDFYRDNSLPYVDRDTSVLTENNKSSHKSSKPSNDLFADIENRKNAANGGDDSFRKHAWKCLDDSIENREDASFDSLVRKLEQTHPPPTSPRLFDTIARHIPIADAQNAPIGQNDDTFLDMPRLFPQYTVTRGEKETLRTLTILRLFPRHTIPMGEREMEHMCQFVKLPNCTYFRGVPLVRCEVITFVDDENTNRTDEKIRWRFAKWNNTPVTLREYPKVKQESKKKASAGRYISTDIDILTKIHHSNMLLLMGLFYEKKTKLCTIFEETIGSLHDYIHLKGNKLSCRTSVEYLSGIASALVYLHTNRYVHTSVSSHSISLTSSRMAKLCNFELCTQILVKNDDRPRQLDNSLDIYKLNYLHEPEYENLEDLKSSFDDMTSDVHYECSSQSLSVRKYFAHFRWQAPELFDDIDDMIYPCTKTDVYSLCLVLWECINNSAPWKSLSYRQLLQLYLNWHTGIRLHQKDLYPPLIYDMLSGGLPINPDERIDIYNLHKKFVSALNQLNEEPAPTLSDALSRDNIQTIDHIDEENTSDEHKLEANTVMLKMKDIKKYQVTNLDDESCANERQSSDEHLNDSETKTFGENLSSLGLSSKESIANTELFIIEESFSSKLQNTDSTEYCSFMTPDVKRFANKTSNYDTSTMPSKLSFTEEYTSGRDTSLTEKILKLNSSLTPKSYKPLHIQTPSSDTIDNIRILTDSFGRRNINDKDKPTYSFEIQNTPLPITPIARNNKIKKNAWLSGKSNDDAKSVSETYDILVTENSIHDNDCSNSMITLPHVFSKSFSNIDTQTEACLPDSDVQSKNNTIGHPTSQRCVGTLTEDINTNPFRRRSYSLNSKPNVFQKSSENVTGVDIKPLVAIHEKWIMEARKKQGRSFSLPDNYRGLYAVKPASHLTDPARPKYAFSSPNSASDCKNDKAINYGCYSDVSPLVRSSVLKKRVINASSLDFFENSLWRKEKEKIIRQTRPCEDPQSSSTPKSKCCPLSVSADKCTNTESIEELCQKFISDGRQQNFNKTYDVFERSTPRRDNRRLNDSAIKSAKSNVLAELADTFERITKSKGDDDVSKDILQSNKQRKDEYFDITITLNPKPNNESRLNVDDCGGGVSVFEARKVFDRSMNHDDFLSGDCYNADEDSVSLPDNVTQSATSEIEEVALRSLKRCQAFPALQDARSTEDMYIDDELTANVDMQTLSENMRLVPLGSNHHEATCNKGQDCCLLKIQLENNCNRILIFCDDSRMRQRKTGLGYSSDEEEELMKLTTIGEEDVRLEMESMPSLNLIDLKSSNNKLSVIEEKSDEDVDSDRDSVESDKSSYVGSGRVVQDLISLYEGENLHNSQNKSGLDKFKSTESELSIIILDDDLNSKDKSSTIQKMYDSDVKHSLIDDIIHV
ncbi:uncharacterized protein LOC143914134 [Arctopsyche grandis]|uniref:uncharacterized protein LOC143914134 n=1 Tax=Arctopsyche grandis TaxID=121162 RepID=UPI00406D9DC7